MNREINPIGYLPNFKKPRENILSLLEFFEKYHDLEKSLFPEKLIEEKICKSKSTARLLINTLENYGLIMRKNDDIKKYEISPAARNWMKNPNSIDLFKIIDPTIQFFSEILYELQDGAKDYSSLLDIARTKYNITLNQSALSRTTLFLKSLGFIQGERAQNTYIYGITPEGIAALDVLGKEYMDKKIESVCSKRVISDYAAPGNKYSILIDQIIIALNKIKDSDYIKDKYMSSKEICIYITAIPTGTINRIYENEPLVLEEDIKKVLEFLSCSLVGAIERRDDRFFALKTLKQFKNEFGKKIKDYIG